jgi:hypothetical protein
MLQCSIMIWPAKAHVLAIEPDISPDPPERWRIPMKNLILAAFAALSLSAAVVPAAFAHSTVAGDSLATQTQRYGAY